MIAPRKKNRNPKSRPKRAAPKSSSKVTSRPQKKKSKAGCQQREHAPQRGLGLKGLEGTDDSEGEEETAVEEETDAEEQEDESGSRMKVVVGIDNGTCFSGSFSIICRSPI